MKVLRAYLVQIAVAVVVFRLLAAAFRYALS